MPQAPVTALSFVENCDHQVRFWVRKISERPPSQRTTSVAATRPSPQIRDQQLDRARQGKSRTSLAAAVSVRRFPDLPRITYQSNASQATPLQHDECFCPLQPRRCCDAHGPRPDCHFHNVSSLLSALSPLRTAHWSGNHWCRGNRVVIGGVRGALVAPSRRRIGGSDDCMPVRCGGLRDEHAPNAVVR